jgi:arylsulfatase A-like enzyme
MTPYSKYLLLALAICVSGISTALAKSNKPNILYIMSDDHTSQAVGVYGSRLAPLDPTPNIDALAKNGIRFDRVFCNYSLCTPSRATIITGQYPKTHGVTNLDGNIPPERQYLPIEIKKAGYETAVIGKWHLKKEPVPFDYYAVLPEQGKYFDPIFRLRGDKPWPQNTIQKKGSHSSDAITDLSLDWLENKRDKSKPFFLMHHFKAPHDMFSNAPRYNDWLKDTSIPEPENMFQPPAGSVGSRGYGSGLGKDKHAPWFLGKRINIPDTLSEEEYAKACYQEFLKRYLRCVKGVDDNVKRLIDYLRERGELDNTVIMYTGDQGFYLGEHDLMDKRWGYEEGMRMPFIVHWPDKIKEGQANDWLINNADFAPTMLELAGLPTPDYMQGRSFASAIFGKEKPADWREVTYYRYSMHMAHKLAVPGHFGVRSDRYKLLFFYGTHEDGRQNQRTPPAWEFYDLKKDPSEMQNEYANPEYASLIATMKSQLKELREQLNETDKDVPAIQEVIDLHWNK